MRRMERGNKTAGGGRSGKGEKKKKEGIGMNCEI